MPKTYVDSLLAEHERIVYVARQHWSILVGSILVEAVVILALLVLSGLIAFLLSPTILAPFGGFIWAAVPLVLILVPLAGMIRDISIWANREYIITNRRVIQIFGVVNKDVTDSSLEKVNDVKMEQSAWGRLFNYGDIEILTASEMGANLFRRISDPVKFKTAMLNAKEELEHGQVVDELPQGARVEDIPGMIARLDQLRQQGVLTEAEFQAKKAELLRKI